MSRIQSGGEDTLAWVSYLLPSFMCRKSSLLPQTVLLKIFLRFPKHKTGWGVRYPRWGIFTPTPFIDMPCDMLLRSIK